MTKGCLALACSLTAGVSLSLGQTQTLPPPRPVTPTPAAAASSVDLPPVGGEIITGGPVTGEAPFDSAGGRGPCDRVWLDGEFLLWKITRSPLPVLVTTGQALTEAVLGQSGTIPDFGGKDALQNSNSRYGGRFTAGLYIDNAQDWSVEATYLFLGQRSDESKFLPDAGPILARPFFNFSTGIPGAELVSFPDLVEGTIKISTPSRFWGAELNLSKRLANGWCYHDYRIEAMVGLRHLGLDESVEITETKLIDDNPQFRGVTPPGYAGYAGADFLIADRFSARNYFYGGQVGFDASYNHHKFAVDLRGKIAAGVTHEEVTIAGSEQVRFPTGLTTTSATGLLAQASNSGRFIQNELAFVPELSLNVGFHATGNFDLFCGYTLLYWSKVVRPGDQIPTALASNEIPNFLPLPLSNGQPLPRNGMQPVTGPLKDSEFLATGVNFGVEFHW